MLETQENTPLFPWMLSLEATRANETATPEETEAAKPAQPVSSSVLLRSFALSLFSEKIQQSQKQMRLGLGGDSETNWSDLNILCSPSDSGHVALALTTNATDCFCLPHYRTPTARDWKGMSAKSWRERTVGDQTPTLPDQLGGTPHPEFVEELMGFPAGWTDLKHLATP